MLDERLLSAAILLSISQNIIELAVRKLLLAGLHRTIENVVLHVILHSIMFNGIGSILTRIAIFALLALSSLDDRTNKELNDLLLFVGQSVPNILKSSPVTGVGMLNRCWFRRLTSRLRSSLLHKKLSKLLLLFIERFPNVCDGLLVISRRRL